MSELSRCVHINGNNAATTPPAGTNWWPCFTASAPTVEDSNYIVIKATGPFTAQQAVRLEEKKVKVLTRVGTDSYLCCYEPKTFEPLDELSDFITEKEVYHPAYVISTALKRNSNAKEQVRVKVGLHSDVKDEGATQARAAIAEKAGIDLEAVTVLGNGGYAELTVSQGLLAEIAKIDAVKDITEKRDLKLFNNEASKIVEAHKEITSLNGKQFNATGQIVCVADTGFDNGKLKNYHKAFENRVVEVIAIGRSRDNLADDPDGHGTHVCGTVLGKGTHKEIGAIESPASGAKLIVQSTLSGFGPLPRHAARLKAPIPDLFAQAHQLGAFVHTNSWGTDSDSPNYDNNTTQPIDEYLWDNKDFVVLFAAGNEASDGQKRGYTVDEKSMCLEAMAKNCITVGASENERTDIVYPKLAGNKKLTYGAWSDFKTAPISQDPVSNNPEGLAAFSSRGPVGPEWRIKPDVVAPGTSILSTRSSAVDTQFFREDWGHSTDSEWCYEGGTSMATPLVCGCAAVIRGALQDLGLASEPSAALIKALIINGAVPLKGQYNKTARVEFAASQMSISARAAADAAVFGAADDDANEMPNPHSGFGRINLKNSLEHLGTQNKNEQSGIADVRPGFSLEKSSPWEKTVTAPASVAAGAKIRVTLAWTDAPGEQLQSDLDLIVRKNGATERHGNMGRSSSFDRVNNVEKVVWGGVKAGDSFVIRITPFRLLPGVEQPFAVVWRISA